MNGSMRWAALGLLGVATVGFSIGCAKTDHPAGSGTGLTKKDEHATHAEHGGADKDHSEHKEGGHDEKPLTEADVKMPESFPAAVARLGALHQQIGYQVEHGELAKVHRTAEELALVAKRAKTLAQEGVPAEKRTEVGRLCNELAGYFGPIDEAADAGKKAETEAINLKIGAAIDKLRDVAK